MNIIVILIIIIIIIMVPLTCFFERIKRTQGKRCSSLGFGLYKKRKHFSLEHFLFLVVLSKNVSKTVCHVYSYFLCLTCSRVRYFFSFLSYPSDCARFPSVVSKSVLSCFSFNSEPFFFHFLS